MDGLTCTTCGTGLETLYYQTQSAPEEKAHLIALHTKPEDRSPDQPQIALLRLNLAIKKREIASESDLDEALAELRQAVEEILKTGKRVILG